jgi:hypothetical protein
MELKMTERTWQIRAFSQPRPRRCLTLISANRSCVPSYWIFSSHGVEAINPICDLAQDLLYRDKHLSYKSKYNAERITKGIKSHSFLETPSSLPISQFITFSNPSYFISKLSFLSCKCCSSSSSISSSSLTRNASSSTPASSYPPISAPSFL